MRKDIIPGYFVKLESSFLIRIRRFLLLSQSFGLTKGIRVVIILQLLLLTFLKNHYRGIDVYDHYADK